MRRFARGAFGDVVEARYLSGPATLAPERRIARTGGGGLVLTQDGDDILLSADPAGDARRMTIPWHWCAPECFADSAIEFSTPSTDEWQGDLRTVTRAGLPSIGVVDRPAFASAAGNRAEVVA